MLRAFGPEQSNISEGIKESPGQLSLTRGYPSTQQVEVSLLPAAKQGVKGMKHRELVFGCLLIICITLIALTLLSRSDLCEVKMKNDNQEIIAKLACSIR
ncbi:Hok/gef family protein [Cedecea davisae DSM 4568]|uniref:Hok/gef family protein n=2 Tax=Enterobacteriaceae TaxID=543 RepID=S3JJQ0_9ENTR|nr:Hok/gef family protein [Cedecea davisae DSM 4568]